MMRCNPHFALRAIVVDFKNQSVGIEIPRLPRSCHFVAITADFFQHVFRRPIAAAAKKMRVDRFKPESPQCFELFAVGRKRMPERFIRKKAQTVIRRQTRVFLFQTAYRQIARADFFAFISAKRRQRHIHFASDFKIALRN